MTEDNSTVHADRDAVSVLPGTDPDRPFGVHFRMAWWKSVIVIIAIPLTLLLTQVIIFQVVVAVEGPADPNRPSLTPLSIAAAGTSTAVTALLMTMLVAAMAKVSWRAVFRHTRKFDWRRVGIYLLGSAVLVILSLGATILIAPQSLGWGSFAVGGTTIAIILVTFVATPLQSAGEEIAFRGVLIPAAGSWFRNVRLAVVFGILVSGIFFAAVHVTLDPWLLAYLMVLSACTAVMGLISGGLEAAMAFHVANNVIAGIVNSLFTGGESTTLDRSVGAGPGANLIILMVMNVSVVVLVWLIERAKRKRSLVSESATGAVT
jgi:uncharacterized protein